MLMILTTTCMFIVVMHLFREVVSDIYDLFINTYLLNLYNMISELNTVVNSINKSKKLIKKSEKWIKNSIDNNRYYNNANIILKILKDNEDIVVYKTTKPNKYTKLYCIYFIYYKYKIEIGIPRTDDLYIFKVYNIENDKYEYNINFCSFNLITHSLDEIKKLNDK